MATAANTPPQGDPIVFNLHVNTTIEQARIIEKLIVQKFKDKLVLEGNIWIMGGAGASTGSPFILYIWIYELPLDLQQFHSDIIGMGAYIRDLENQFHINEPIDED